MKVLLFALFVIQFSASVLGTSCNICDAIANMTTPVCFSCSTPVRVFNGSYVTAGEIQVGDELYSGNLLSNRVFVKNISRQIITQEDQGLLRHMIPGVCGPGQPRSHVIITQNHAIRCPLFMEMEGVPMQHRKQIYIFPDSLPSDPPPMTHEICNIDVGDPEVPLILDGLMAESWDGVSATSIRSHAWKRHGTTPFHERLRVERRSPPPSDGKQPSVLLPPVPSK